ncbi:MAG: PAS domain-containing protein [Candidatus Manganitrophus sp.]|nr:MAG: PAS domain-containing protein [Candidatus Manganitrophus sp.]
MENKIGIRSRAEAKLTRSKAPPKTLSPEETQELIHELQVHQLELEMQNEDLRSSRSELEALLSRYADLYDSAPIGYCTLDQNGLVMEINLKGAELLGIERRHLIQRPFLIYVAEEDRARFRSYLSMALKNGGGKHMSSN